ncbi:MAG: ABC transporter ATP-binding protein [Gemmatimonadales bacterium]
MTAPALAITGLAAPFGRETGLADVSFDVAPGERLAIVGGSGTGKTTLLRAIAGLGAMSAGRVLIGGRDVSTEPPERRDAVYLHQTPLLFPHLSAGENVAFPLRVRSVPDAEVDRRVGEALASVRLETFAGRVPRTLSGGQRHRVALARAVVARPTALLLDEPLSALDPTLRDEVRESLLALQQVYRPALVLVTHDLDEAGLLADRIGVLLDGRLAQVAPPAELFARPATLAVARFLGIPNLVPGVVLADGRFECMLGTLSLHRVDPRPQPGPGVVVFRPRAARIRSDGTVAGEVVEVRHRVRDTTVVVRSADRTIEVQVVDGGPPRIGARVAIAVEPEACYPPEPSRQP